MTNGEHPYIGRQTLYSLHFVVLGDNQSYWKSISPGFSSYGEVRVGAGKDSRSL